VIDLAEVPLALTLLGEGTVLADALNRLLRDVAAHDAIVAGFSQLIGLPGALEPGRERPSPAAEPTGSAAVDPRSQSAS
jgi:hypothetical protein